MGLPPGGLNTPSLPFEQMFAKLLLMMGEGGESRLTIQEAEELATDLGLLLRERDEISFQAASLAGVLDDVDYGEHEDSVSTIDWLRHRFQLGYRQAADLVAVGRQLSELEHSVNAFLEGQIGFQHLVVLARTKQSLRSGAGFDEQQLVAEAKEVSVGRFWHICEEARHAADAEAVAREQASKVEIRELHVNQREDGYVTVGGILDPVGGAALRSALEPLAGKTAPDDSRRRERRLADALVELATHAMDQSTPSQRPHLNVTATLGTVYRIPGSPSAEVDHGAPVSEITVGRIACDCTITRHIFDSKRVLIELGRSKRVISPQLRKALERRDRHCSWPGCTRHPSWCEAHHVIAWTRGGATNLDNLVLLCTRHHWMVHEGKWQLFRTPNGRLQVLRPPIDFLAYPRGPDSETAA